MGVIFGLFLTGEGLIRSVAQTEYTAEKCLELSITKALDREEGPLYDWIREVWREGHEVRARVLQDNVIPAELAMFEGYWMEQFDGLIDGPARGSVAGTTEVGDRVHDDLRAELRGESARDA
jgi:hypothetical protein